MPAQDLEAHVDLLRQPPAGAPRAGGADGLRPRGDPHLGAGLRRRGGRQVAEGRRRQAGLLGRLQELTVGESLHLGNKLRELALPMFRPRCTSADLAQMVDVDCIKFLLVLFY